MLQVAFILLPLEDLLPGVYYVRQVAVPKSSTQIYPFTPISMFLSIDTLLQE